jgi:hypothetical protein
MMAVLAGRDTQAWGAGPSEGEYITINGRHFLLQEKFADKG